MYETNLTSKINCNNHYKEISYITQITDCVKRISSFLRFRQHNCVNAAMHRTWQRKCEDNADNYFYSRTWSLYRQLRLA